LQGTRHAEFVAIDALLAASAGDVAAARFPECDLYVSCEPCIMCAGALSLLGVRSVVFGCPNDKFGGNGSIVPVHQLGCGACSGDAGVPPEAASGRPLGKTYPSRGGLRAAEAVALLQDFYVSGNPHAPVPHRPVRARPESALPDDVDAERVLS
jgi:tRNA-specific adenosine deaminase 2